VLATPEMLGKGQMRWRDGKERGVEGEEQVEEEGGGGWGVPGAATEGLSGEGLATDSWSPARSSSRRLLRVPSWACLPAAGHHHRCCHRHRSFSPLRPPPACLPARPCWVLERRGWGERDGEREAVRRAGRRKGGRLAKSKEGGMSEGGGDRIGRGWGGPLHGEC
jgi:hypothetical protein